MNSNKIPIYSPSSIYLRGTIEFGATSQHQRGLASVEDWLLGPVHDIRVTTQRAEDPSIKEHILDHILGGLGFWSLGL